MTDSHPLRGLTAKVTPLPTPEELTKAHPLGPTTAQAIVSTRAQIIDIMEGKDDRLMVVVGPCSEDDSVQPDGTPSAVRYAREIRQLIEDETISKHLLIVMRCNPAKPRSDLGLAGLEQKDPVAAHKLLTGIVNIGVPLAIEVMSSDHLARYGRLLSLAWVGARNISDTHLRHALSAHDELPVFCKNGERGELKPALQAIKTINEPHANARITLPDGRAGHVSQTNGNPHTGLTWRGGTDYMSPEGFEKGLKEVAATGLPYSVDCAHSNEIAHDPVRQKSVQAQKNCFNHLVKLMQDRVLNPLPKAVMIESYLLEGNDTTQKTPGCSWTDPCINLEDTKIMIQQLAQLHAKLTEKQ